MPAISAHDNLRGVKYSMALLRQSVVAIFFFVLAFSIVNPAYAVNSTVERLIEEGVSLSRNKQVDDALRKFNQVLLIEPNNAEAYFRIGQVLLDNNDTAGGIENIKKSTKLDPANPRYSLNLAAIYEKRDEIDKALQEYQRLIDTGSRDKRVKEAEKRVSLVTGQRLAKKGEMNAALLIFNGLLLEYPEDTIVLFNIGAAYVLLNRVEEAEATFRKLIVLEPKATLVHLNLANIYEHTGRADQALYHLQQIIDINVSADMTLNARIRHGIIMGREYVRKQEWAKAIETFKSVAALDPKQTEALFNIALAYLNLGNPKEAEARFLGIISGTPDDFAARLNLGSLYIDLGRQKEAEDQLSYIIENDKAGRYASQAKARMNLMHTIVADKALQQGNVEESLREYKKALDYYSGNVKASFNRGMILIQQRRFDDAIVEFESVIRFTPEDARARLNLAMLYEQVNRLTDAASQFEKIVQIAPNTQEGQAALQKWKITKAKGLLNDKKLTEAEAVLDEIVAVEKLNFEAYFYLGVIQSSKGKFRDAARSYQILLDSRPNNQQVRLLLGKVYEQMELDELAAQEYRAIIFAGAAREVVDDANERLKFVESRLSGFSRSLSYNFQSDSNINLNDEFPVSELRSDLAFNIVYGQRVNDDFSFKLSTSPTYSNYHFGQFDYVNMDWNLGVKYGSSDSGWLGNVGRRVQQSLLTEDTASRVSDYQVSRSRKVFLPAVFNLNPEGFEEEDIATSISTAGTIRQIETFGSNGLTSLMGSFSVYASQSLRWGIGGTAGYSFGVFRSLKIIQQFVKTNVVNPVSGSPESVTILVYNSEDYEYNSHTASLNVSKVLAPGLFASLGGALVYTGYINEDSGAYVQGFIKTRDNLTIALSANASYRFIKDLSFTFGGSLTKNLSNLAVGYTQSEESAIAAQQSTSLGAYTNFSVSGGLNMVF